MTRRWTIALIGALLSLTTLGAQGRSREAPGHNKFDDNDRKVAHEWSEQHRNKPPKGFRDRDRLEQQHETLLREGYVLDQGFRDRIRPLPPGLRLAQPPRQQRYVVIGGHVVLIDRGYRVHDVLHLESNF